MLDAELQSSVLLAGVKGNDRQEENMSVFGSIVSAIFGSKHAAGVTPAATPSSSAPSSTGATPASSAPPSPSAGATASSATPAAAAAAKPISRADVEAILHKVAADVREDLDWKRSIVDLMKLLKLDSGLGARKQLAQELGYAGALDGSADMNIWLHKQVMTKLAESGGKIPDSLKA
jgi:3-oxoacyl-ACP reductase-like protein